MDSLISEKQMPTNFTIDSAINMPPDKRGEFVSNVMEVEKSAWPPELWASREKFESRMITFPQGFIVVKIDNKIKGVSTSQITTYDLSTDKTWNEITDNGTIKTTHDHSADSLYVVSVGVSPDTQGMGIGGKLVAAQIELTKKLGLKRLFLGARIPSYDQYCKNQRDIDVDAYLKLKTRRDEALDPEIRFYERQGLHVVKVVSDFELDPESRNYGVVMVWENSSLIK